MGWGFSIFLHLPDRGTIGSVKGIDFLIFRPCGVKKQFALISKKAFKNKNSDFLISTAFTPIYFYFCR